MTAHKRKTPKATLRITQVRSQIGNQERVKSGYSSMGSVSAVSAPR